MNARDETKLTDRQREAFALVRPLDQGGRGMTTKQASQEMGISYNAANEHVRNLREKGFLKKRDGRANGRGSAPSKPEVGTTVVGTNGRFGRVAVKLQEAETVAKEVRAEIDAEMEELSRRQHDLAAEAEGIETLSQDIHQRVEALA